MTEARNPPTRVRKIAGWVLVILGIPMAILGLIGMGFYSPSLSELELLQSAMFGLAICAVGVLMVLLGWYALTAE